jgi:SAM-dependent methyltransferase
LEPEGVLAAVERYYSGKLAEHGPTPKGVDWKDEASQRLRFEQLTKICDQRATFTINDYGCGYGALAAYLERWGWTFRYTGFDISRTMLDQARRLHGSDRIRFVARDEELVPADYTVASGIFNVKLEADDDVWQRYVIGTLARLDALSKRGFSFNMLTSYSDPDRMRPDLHYADPSALFDHCKRNFSRWVALLHDYGLYEFTILIRKDVEAL